ncbi:MAG: ankyrin repeat domain-containing protein [Pseudomonadota bacterium]
MKNRYLIPALMAALLLPTVASAQFSDSFNFIKAVKDADGAKATEFLNKPGTVIVNTRDAATGQTGLHIVTARRDATWLGFLLQRGASPDVRDNNGKTALMIATELRWTDGIQVLLARRASVDVANGNGETPLAKAVINNDIASVRLLLAANANPNRADNAGFSPKDLARRDPRLSGVLKELDAAKPAPKREVQGPR